MNESEIIEGLRSRDLGRQVMALGEAGRTIRELMAESVRAFVEAEAPYPMAEGLFKFGPAIIPMLEELLLGSAGQDVKDLAAAILVKLGCRTGASTLLAVLTDRRPWFPMAARILAAADVSDAATRIQNILETLDCAADPYSATTLVEALKRVGTIPDSLKDSLRQRWPRQMRAGLEELLQG
jgi:hypothetical protein